jgi:hypothetical protein
VKLVRPSPSSISLEFLAQLSPTPGVSHDMKSKLSYLTAACGLLLATASVLQAQDAGKNAEAKKNHQARMLAKFDTNHNGVIDPDEQMAMDKFKADMLAKYDKNGDGKLDKSEREAMKADRKANRKNKGVTPVTTGTSSAPKP